LLYKIEWRKFDKEKWTVTPGSLYNLKVWLISDIFGFHMSRLQAGLIMALYIIVSLQLVDDLDQIKGRRRWSLELVDFRLDY